MSNFLSPESEAVLSQAVSAGIFADTRQALDEAVRLLNEQLEIEKALLKGLNSGDPIRVDDAEWESMRQEILRLHEARKS